MVIESMVEDYLYKYHYKMLPVTGNGRLAGCVTLNQVKNLPRAAWPDKTVNEITTPCSEENTVNQNSNAIDALSKMNANNASRLMVVNDNQELAGIIALKDMMEFLSMKIELENEEKGMLSMQK